MPRQRKPQITDHGAYLDVRLGATVTRISRDAPDTVFLGLLKDALSLYPALDVDRPGIFDSMANLRAALDEAGLLVDGSPEADVRLLPRKRADAEAYLRQLAADGRGRVRTFAVV